MERFAFIDTETTGTRPGTHELLEIGAVLTAAEPPYAVLDSFSLKVHPERLEDADPIALSLNAFNESEWHDALSVADAVRAFCERVRGAALWGWNVGFDRAFLEPAMNRAGIGLEDYGLDYTWYDLKMEFRRWAMLVGREREFAPRFSLGAACRAFGVENENAHRALPDALATYRVFLRLGEEFSTIAMRLRNEALPI
jgi:DNA polymerase-3 subunit alpha (Gram-positive type)